MRGPAKDAERGLSLESCGTGRGSKEQPLPGHSRVENKPVLTPRGWAVPWAVPGNPGVERGGEAQWGGGGSWVRCSSPERSRAGGAAPPPVMKAPSSESPWECPKRWWERGSSRALRVAARRGRTWLLPVAFAGLHLLFLGPEELLGTARAPSLWHPQHPGALALHLGALLTAP